MKWHNVPWPLLLIVHPAKALDWHDPKDPDGGLDHGKVVADLIVFALTAVVVFVAIRKVEFPPWGIVVTLIAGGMGSRVFMGLIKARGKDTGP